MNKETALITNELLLAILSQMHSIELILADVYNGKANLRFSNAVLEKDAELLQQLGELVQENMKEVTNESQDKPGKE